MDIGEWLENGGQLFVAVIADPKDFELAVLPTHGRGPCTSPSCDCAAVFAARQRLDRAGLRSRGKLGGFHPPAPRRTLGDEVIVDG